MPIRVQRRILPLGKQLPGVHDLFRDNRPPGFRVSGWRREQRPRLCTMAPLAAYPPITATLAAATVAAATEAAATHATTTHTAAAHTAAASVAVAAVAVAAAAIAAATTLAATAFSPRLPRAPAAEL